MKVCVARQHQKNFPHAVDTSRIAPTPCHHFPPTAAATQGKLGLQRLRPADHAQNQSDGRAGARRERIRSPVAILRPLPDDSSSATCRQIAGRCPQLRCHVGGGQHDHTAIRGHLARFGHHSAEDAAPMEWVTKSTMPLPQAATAIGQGAARFALARSCGIGRYSRAGIV